MCIPRNYIYFILLITIKILITNLNYISLAILFISILSPICLKAAEPDFKSVSLSAGTSNYNEKDFRSLEIRGNSSLPFISHSDNGNYRIMPVISFSFGSLMQDEEVDFFTTITSGIALSTYNDKIDLDAGGGFAFLSDDKVEITVSEVTFSLLFNRGSITDLPIICS